MDNILYAFVKISRAIPKAGLLISREEEPWSNAVQGFPLIFVPRVYVIVFLQHNGFP